jgi:hypothetical protein
VRCIRLAWIGSNPQTISLRILKRLLGTEEDVILWIDPGFAGCWSFIQNVFFIIAAYASCLIGFFTFLGGI